ncbi:TPA: M-phase phosphoprotein 8 [Trebouxia sp. C0004]
MALGRKVSPDETIVLVFDILRRMALIQQEVDKRTLVACMNLEMTASIEQKEKDQPAALFGGEGKQAQKQIDDAVEKHLQANKPNQSTGRADTSMDHAEYGREPAAEIEKEDDFVAAANARDTVVVKSTPMSQSERTKANNAGRSKPIELFHGKPEQCGKDAKDWLSTVEIYLDSVNEKRPVPIVVTYLRGDAQSWWTQFGKDQIGLQASFAAFKDIFLARFVKPGDSRKARQELATMQQNDMSVETYAAQFRNCAARIAASKVDGEEEFEVDEILTHKPQGRKKTDPKVKLLVKWAGYKDEHNTWEPYKNLKNASDALNEYWDIVAVRAAAKSKKRGPDGYVASVSKKFRGK